MSPAAFDPTDALQIQAIASWVHDSNLFRLPDVSAPPSGSGIDPAQTADTIRILGAGLKLDKVISRQRLIADLNLNQSVYEKNANLDYLGGDGRLAWLWQAGADGSGEAGYRKRRTLTAFTDFHLNQRDLIDTETYTLTAGYQFHPRWRIAGEFLKEDLVRSVQQTLDVNSRSAGATLVYRTPGENSIGLQARSTDRTYPIRALGSLDNDHRETRLNAIAVWRFSGALQLDAQVGHVDVRYDEVSSRDFAGVSWRGAATWDPTGKLRLSLNGFRDVRLYQSDTTNYVVATAVGLSPIYAVTTKITVQGDFNFEKDDFRANSSIVNTGAPPRADNVRLARVSLRYSPVRNVELSVAREIGSRTSNFPINDFQYQLWLGTIRASF